MHAADFANCVNGISTVNNGDPYCPALAALGMTGVNYVAASTSKPSDSFPGLTAIITGGSPALTGVYYDVAYSRNYDAPAKTTGNGLAAGPCTPYATPTGTTTEYEEGIDYRPDQSERRRSGAVVDRRQASTPSIPQKLIRDPNNGCNPVFPWNFVRTNSIFSVIHGAGGYAAWSDKHPAYSSVASGLGPVALDDFYAPEINSNVIALPGVKTPTGLSCATVPDPGSDTYRLDQQLPEHPVLRPVEGQRHPERDRRQGPPRPQETTVPNIFGMNFQAVSVGQKLVEKPATTPPADIWMLPARPPRRCWAKSSLSTLRLELSSAS